MSKFVIEGGKDLSGEIKISGSKNACMPLMAACLLTDEECVLTNVPAIKDVETMAEVLRDLGATVESDGDRIKIKAEKITKHEPAGDLVAKFRGAVLLLGALLARTGRVAMPHPGGDKIGKRPVDTHIAALEALGAKFSAGGGLVASADKLTGAKIVLEETSVTATENVLLAAATASGRTVVKLAAMEPHVQQLGEFLNMMGAKIAGLGTTTIIIDGVEKLRGAEIAVIPDSEESASFITLAAAAKSHVKISNINPEHLEDFLLKLKKMNVNFQIGPDYVEVLKPEAEYVATKIQCGFYPKLNSDCVPPMSVLATQAAGETTVYEWLYENRFGYIAELKRMGADAEVLDPHRAVIKGPTKLKGTNIVSYDLRMGMTLVIAALIADGKSEISDIHHIDRGYANLEENLRALGADIKRVE